MDTAATSCTLGADEHRWAAARRRALARDEYRCRSCEVEDWHATLVVHHVWPVAGRGGYDDGCQHHLDGLLTLCEPCHVAEHRWLDRVLAVRSVDRHLAVVEQLALPVAV